MSGTAHLADRPHFIYRCFGPDDRLLYIGCTVNLRQRLTSHRTQSLWSARVARITVVGPFVGSDARRRAMRREAELIAAERPLFNLTIAGQDYLQRRRGQEDYLHAGPTATCTRWKCDRCGGRLLPDEAAA